MNELLLMGVATQGSFYKRQVASGIIYTEAISRRSNPSYMNGNLVCGVVRNHTVTWPGSPITSLGSIIYMELDSPIHPEEIKFAATNGYYVSDYTDPAAPGAGWNNTGEVYVDPRLLTGEPPTSGAYIRYVVRFDLTSIGGRIIDIGLIQIAPLPTYSVGTFPTEGASTRYFPLSGTAGIPFMLLEMADPFIIS